MSECAQVGGLFLAGGGSITVEQAEIYNVLEIDPSTHQLKRPGDYCVVSQDSEGNVSGTGILELSLSERCKFARNAG